MAASGVDLRGLTVLRYADDIDQLLEPLDRSQALLLDYGCGGGDAYREPHRLHERWRVQHPIMFDPAFTKYARPIPPGPRQGRYDGVLCVDVLEHLDQRTVTEVVCELFSRAETFVFATVCSRPARKTFSDGTNLHTLIKPLGWWVQLFEDVHSMERSARGEGVKWRLMQTP